jgi:hypothetical protein
MIVVVSLYPRGDAGQSIGWRLGANLDVFVPPWRKSREKSIFIILKGLKRQNHSQMWEKIRSRSAPEHSKYVCTFLICRNYSFDLEMRNRKLILRALPGASPTSSGQLKLRASSTLKKKKHKPARLRPSVKSDLSSYPTRTLFPPVSGI